MNARVARAAEMTGIGQYMELNPYEIPYSTKKFVSIAAILAVQTPYLVLDEPTAGQDTHGVNCLVHIMDTLRSEGKGVIVITHDMEFVARNFERVVVMAHRHIIADGSVREVFQNDAVLHAAAIQKPQMGQLASSLGHPGYSVQRRPRKSAALKKILQEEAVLLMRQQNFLSLFPRKKPILAMLHLRGKSRQEKYEHCPVGGRPALSAAAQMPVIVEN